MNRVKGTILFAVTLAVASVEAATFGTGSNQFSMAFLEIGNPGNLADSSGFGSVDHTYSIGTYEVSVEQFFKARAEDSRIGSGNEDYWNDGTRTVGPGAPVARVSWYEAARFANWLTSGDAYAGAYQFDTNGTLVAVDRYAAMFSYGTVYVLPSENEWFKAAYYKPVNDGSYAVYANGSTSGQNLPLRGTTNGWNYAEWVWNPTLEVHYANSSPNYVWETGFGGQEQNGTYDMNGNLYEWCESAYEGSLNDNLNTNRVIRGGDYYVNESHMSAGYRHSSFSPTHEHAEVGFRVAALPPTYYELQVILDGNGSVNVSNGWYVIGTNLAMIATPETNWLFVGWSGDLSGGYTTSSTNLIINTNKSITATFSDDADGDGLLNTNEYSLGTDPRDSDSDDDNLLDGTEVNTYGSDPLVADTDVDGLSDGDEINTHGTDPLVADSDADGLSDGDEVNIYLSDPLDADTDGDAMPDGWEAGYGLDPLLTNALADADVDGNPDLYEFAMGGNPTNAVDSGYAPFYVVSPAGGTNWVDYIHARRTNAAALDLSYVVELGSNAVPGSWTNSGYAVMGTSSLSNGFETVTNRMDAVPATNVYVRLSIASSNAVVYSATIEITPLDVWAGSYGLYGTNAASTNDADADGLSNLEEFNAGTSPVNSDSDGDTFDDGLEVANGGDPLQSDLWRVDYIRNNGSAYDLYPSNSVVDLAMGQSAYVVSNGTATLWIQLKKSFDLVNWTNAGDAVFWQLPVESSNTFFYRVDAAQ